VIKFLDYTFLNHEINHEDIIKFCTNANRHIPAAICIFPEHIKIAKKVLNSNIAIAALAGKFPEGSNDCLEIEKDIISAINLGADEIDVVLEPRNTEN
jgi:deoxyribose-phosphate aldolase